MSEDKKTSLYDEHIKLGAKIVPFGGWAMPVQYEGIIKEHHATRNFAGLFDVSHMGEVFIKGKDSLNFLQSIVAQDLTNLEPSKAIYCHLPNEDGGLIDDIIIYNAKGIIEEIEYLIVINASRIDFNIPHMQKMAQGFDVEVINKSDDLSMLALQGPNAKFIIEKMGISQSEQPKFFTFKSAILNACPVFLTRTGYTGEDGFEIIFEHKYASKLWNEILSYKEEFSVVPVGLGARDTLRLEAGLPLYGHELNENTTPIESSLGFFIPKEKEQNYIGKKLIQGQKTKELPLRRKLFAFIMEDRMIARAEYPVYINDIECGVVTSGAPSPTLGKNIGFCMIEFDKLESSLVSKLNNIQESLGMTIQIMVRNKLYNAKIVKKPFIEKKYNK
ncbi:MAG: glycine cleavage system aminomethyltransferase GcvT [Candidatus Gastranaerophilales bacterium]|nr:glycine cleavage system aminomethyltransferase GcvT [Candidatus Gastranaerophilales bacterium]